MNIRVAYIKEHKNDKDKRKCLWGGMFRLKRTISKVEIHELEVI